MPSPDPEAEGEPLAELLTRPYVADLVARMQARARRRNAPAWLKAWAAGGAALVQQREQAARAARTHAPPAWAPRARGVPS